jgi:hypothetical protein
MRLFNPDQIIFREVIYYYGASLNTR